MRPELTGAGRAPGFAQARAGLHACLQGLSLLVFCVMLGALRDARAADDEPRTERLTIADPYVELRTGPGRNYPVFYVAGRHESIDVELRHTDWFKVRTESGKEGWVDRAQLENTLTEAGSRKSFRDILLDDYLKRRMEFGAAWGHLSSQPVLKLWADYSLTDTIALEATLGEVQGQYSGTTLWHLDLLVQPWSEKRVGPFFGVGVGRMNYAPNASLVGAIPVNSNSANAMIGVQVHVTDRLIARLDWAAYTSLVSASQTAQFHALMGGLAFFF